MAISDAALRAVIANAMRHLIEADQHYKAGRYPSAETSAIFSIEETGKLGFLTATGSAVKAKKHAAYAIPFLGITGLISTLPKMAEWREVLRGGKASAATLTAAQRQIVADHSEFAEFMQRVEAGELEDAAERHVALAGAVLAREHKDRSFKSFWDTILKEGLQAARLKATYVEVTDSGVREPDVNDKHGAEGLCAAATLMFGLMVATALMSRPTLNVDALIESIPEDLTGTDLLQAFYAMFGGGTPAENSG